LLIPRAVGYSAGLLNYFFRGTLGAEGTSNAIRITNHSNEEMNGIFTLYYDNDNAERHPVGNASWNLSLPANSRSDELTFEIPPDARDAGRYMLVFRGTMGAESDAVVGRLVQLPQPYVFIVQDTASLGAPVITDLGLLDRGTEAPDQVLSGHFVAHGRMIRISLISSCLGCAPLRLLINGHERPNASWMEGDTPTQPVTWQVTNIPQGRSYEIIMRVDVTDGANSAYFLQHLLHYTGLGNGAFPVIQHKAVGDYVIQKSTELTIERPVFAQLFPLESRHGHWRVVQMAGHRPEDECATSGGTSGCEAPSEACNRYGVAGHVSVDEEFITEITLDTLDPAWKYTHSWQCNLTDTLPVSYSELLSTEEFLPLTITAELIKEYTPEDLKYFESIGIAPVYYSVIFE
ncbi:MAG: hypothetical protein HY208_00965, partial [Nitrospirae bacterium]|nr:hypothetical protein [Nitrospirota bacterium]